VNVASGAVLSNKSTFARLAPAAADAIAVMLTVAGYSKIELLAGALMLAAGGPITVMATEAETLGLLSASPLYRAVKLCCPSTVIDALNEAMPEFSAAAPRVLEPSKNVTTPVGVEPLTVAVKTTD